MSWYSPELCINDYNNNHMDKYLMGYLRAGVPFVTILDHIRGTVSVRKAKESIEEQKIINDMNGEADKKIVCFNRTLIGQPLIYYGYAKDLGTTTVKDDLRIKEEGRRLSQTMDMRSVSRQIYGDEVFIMVGVFEIPQGKAIMALGKVKKADGTEQPIKQVIHIEKSRRLKIISVGVDGLCYPITYPKKGNVYEWQMQKRYIGVPTLRVTIESQQAKREYVLGLDKETYRFKVLPNEEEHSDNIQRPE